MVQVHLVNLLQEAYSVVARVVVHQLHQGHYLVEIQQHLLLLLEDCLEVQLQQNQQLVLYLVLELQLILLLVLLAVLQGLIMLLQLEVHFSVVLQQLLLLVVIIFLAALQRLIMLLLPVVLYLETTQIQQNLVLLEH